MGEILHTPEQKIDLTSAFLPVIGWHYRHISSSLALQYLAMPTTSINITGMFPFEVVGCLVVSSSVTIR